ncbi:MAG: peptidylprolyl isomerase [Trueperaceae bacterium]|nr:MAG: peptidylprolyl isomerase [Trueperaceae bacterium]
MKVPEGTALVPFLSEERQTSFIEPQDVLEPGADYLAVLDTNRGRIVIDLFETGAPRTVNNFVFLTRHRYFDGIVFHRVLEDFMAQTGDPTGTGRGGPGYDFEDEFNSALRHDKRGTVSMANSGPNTNGSQFFITFQATPWLDDRHAVFGQVVEGDDVLSALTLVDPSSPQAVIQLDESVADLSSRGVTLKGAPEKSVGDYLGETLGAVPALGQSFSIDGFQGVIGRVGDAPAAGFFPEPDLIETAFIARREASE